MGRLDDFKEFFDFCGVVMGFKDMNLEHKALCEWIQHNKSKFKLILMPRHTFKSCICTVAYSLWRLVYNPNLRILIYSDATSKAQGFLTSIKNYILGNSGKFRDIFGHWETDAKTGKWNESMILIQNRTASHAEPTIETAGIETSLTGRHYDLIIFDDIVSDVNVTTKEQMDKTADCYKKALSLLRPGGEIVMVGTRWHFGELYGRIIAEKKDDLKNILFHRNSGYLTGEPLFKECGLTMDFLKQQYATQGTYMASCLYENSPVDPETAVFKHKDFAFYGSIEPTDLYITCTCDPAGSGEDFTAITVVGTDHNMDMYVMEVVNRHMQPSDTVEMIMRLNRKWKFKKFGLETNFYRGMLKMDIDRRINEERVEPGFNLFGVEEFKASSRRGENKNSRIMALQPYHERGALKFPGESVELLKDGFYQLAFQMIEFPHSAHDDILDSLAYHLPLIRKGGVVKKTKVPRFTPAWLERMELEKELEIRKHIPRRYRRPVDRLSFS